ncbi:hypothetical protein HQ37_07730 [Porphyromonas sp. COT-239 OH1446]|nr:hypothetical protein HQ37_07730 [Porphyromonas sp. COT-239 OH1446]
MFYSTEQQRWRTIKRLSEASPKAFAKREAKLSGKKPLEAAQQGSDKAEHSVWPQGEAWL